MAEINKKIQDSTVCTITGASAWKYALQMINSAFINALRMLHSVYLL